MTLTYRDGITTALAGAVVLVATRVDGPRLAVGALAVLGITMCAVGTRSEDMATRAELARRPAMIAGTILGSIALALIVVGLIVGSPAIVAALAAVLVAAWVVATLRHMFAGTHDGQVIRAV